MDEETKKVKNIIDTQKIEIGTTFTKNYNCFNCFKQLTKKEYTSKNSHLPRIVLKEINNKLKKDYYVQVILYKDNGRSFYNNSRLWVQNFSENYIFTRKIDINMKNVFLFNTTKDDLGNYQYTFMGLYKLIQNDYNSKLSAWGLQNIDEKIVSIDEESIISKISE